MPPQKKQSTWVQISRYSTIGVLLPASAVTGYFIGVLLDHLFDTNFLNVVFLLIGIVAGFVEMIRIVTRNSE